MEKKVAFIVVCWNNKKLLEECIQSIKAQTYKNTAIYLIDNASTDGSADYVEKNHPDIKLVRSDKNNGFAKGNNILIKKASQDSSVGYFAFVNTDATLAPTWTEKLVVVAESNPKTAGLQGLTMDYYNHHITDSEHIYIAPNLQSTQYGYEKPVNKQNHATHLVMGVNAAAAMYTRAFVDVQPFDTLFDESFFMYLEDVDVSLRAFNMGWANYFVADAHAYHMGSVSSKTRSSDFALYWTSRNQFALLTKNMPARVFWRSFPKFAKFEIQFIRHLRKNYSKKTARVYIKGRFVGALRAPLYISKRWKVASKSKITPDYYYSVMAKSGILG
ncbi:MAG: glycosyl transferase family protein [Candidatus Saccharibacteria bacterium]|nr:glycosyl transferase family protein [Candidatus Saccharibacteria bacterium]